MASRKEVVRMEQWQVEAVQRVLDTPATEMEPGQRVDISSGTYGTSRYHVVDKLYNGVHIEQVEIDEKWSKRVNLSADELPLVLKTLLTWYLEEVYQREHAVDDGLPF
jgi:hypothetical protein